MMKSGQIVYVVRLSEDGNSGVFGNVKAVFDHISGTGYKARGIHQIKNGVFRTVKYSYRALCAELGSRKYEATIECCDGCEISVQKFRFNQI
jgi:hypothetical protein